MKIKIYSKYINPIVLKETYNKEERVVKSSKKEKNCKQTKQFKTYESLNVHLKAPISGSFGVSIPISALPIPIISLQWF